MDLRNGSLLKNNSPFDPSVLFNITDFLFVFSGHTYSIEFLTDIRGFIL